MKFVLREDIKAVELIPTLDRVSDGTRRKAEKEFWRMMRSARILLKGFIRRGGKRTLGHIGAGVWVSYTCK